MKTKIIVLGIALITTMSLFAGCDKQKNTTNDEKTTTKFTEDNQSNLAQFKGAENWETELSATDVHGTDYKLMVNAKVVVPEAENMSVAEIECIDDKESIEEKLEKSYGGPEELRNYDVVSKVEVYPRNIAESMQNKCKISVEEAKELADSFLNEIGRSGQIYTGENPIVWHGENFSEDSNLTDEKYVTYGYAFSYCTELDGIALSQFPDFQNFDIIGRDSYFGEAYNDDETTIFVTDEGVIDATVKDPVVIRQIVSPEVKLLPLDTIKDIIQNELTENGEQYDFSMSHTFNQLQLMYFKTKSETSEGVFSYIPVWCLFQKSGDGPYMYMHPVFVNAIDGNVIYVTDLPSEYSGQQ